MDFNNFADGLAGEYGLFTLALTGLYQQVRAPGAEITPRAIADLNWNAHELATTLYTTATTRIDAYLQPLLDEVSRDTQVSLIYRKKELLKSIERILLENVAQVVRLARVGVNNFASMLKNSHGAMGMLVQKAMATIEFKATDSAGRKWEAKKLVRFLARDFAYQSLIDSQAANFMAMGQDLMQTSKGDVFSLMGSAGHPSFATVRSKYFHPNSNSIMVPHVSSQP